MPLSFATQNTEAGIICYIGLGQWGRNQALSLTLIPDSISAHNHTTQIILMPYAIMGYCSLKLACVICLGMPTYTCHKTSLEDVPSLSPPFCQPKIQPCG